MVHGPNLGIMELYRPQTTMTWVALNLCLGGMMVRMVTFLMCLNGLVLAQTPLERAAKRGDLAKTKALLAKGADVNGVDLDSLWVHTPLIAAASSGREQVVGLLLSKGADPNLYNGAGSTALLYAIQRSKSPSMVRALLEAKANIEQPTDDGTNRTPLIWAILGNQPEIVAILLDHGAKVDVVMENPISQERHSAIELAEKRGHPAIVEMLKAPR